MVYPFLPVLAAAGLNAVAFLFLLRLRRLTADGR
jgi:hypothetical protein